MKYCYIRASLNNPKSLEKQRNTLIERAGTDAVIIEETNGKEQREIMLEKLQCGDSLYIVSEDRIIKPLSKHEKPSEKYAEIVKILKEKNVSLYVTEYTKEDSQ